MPIGNILLTAILLLCQIANASELSYHGKNGQRGHQEDFEAVLPFVWNDRLEEWGKSITDVLDRFNNNSVPEYGGISTYKYFNQKYGLTCPMGDHRIFFHWGYQRKPWCDAILPLLPNHVTQDSALMENFRKDLTNEQARRNRLANKMTEQTFGFGSSGRSARYANALITLIYDVHILGDYETANAIGLASVNQIVAEISTALNNIDAARSKPLVKDLRSIAGQNKSDSDKALLCLDYLRKQVPLFIYNADDGVVNFRKHFQDCGFVFREQLVLDRFNDKKKEQTSECISNVDNAQEVWVTKSGNKYHKAGCHNLLKAKNPTKMPISEAIGKHYVAAKCCMQ